MQHVDTRRGFRRRFELVFATRRFPSVPQPVGPKMTP